MRILDLQRRLREVGRIRIGQKVATSNGKTRPAKLETFRLTSRDRQVIDAAAGQWGGTVAEWKDAPDGGQWQVTTTTGCIPVIVPPGDMSFSQAYEQWTAGGCKIRCDGHWDHVGDRACHCDPEDRACDIHTRLSVILPDLTGLGVWRLDTQGYYAAVELGGIADICAQAAGRGAMLPARLRLEQRSVKRVGNGKIVTLRFAVPVLDVDVHPLVLAGTVDASTGEIAGPVRAALRGPAFTPVPPVDGALAPSFADQVAAIDSPQDRPPRRNAAEAVPATGLPPRTAREAEDDAPVERSGMATPDAGEPHERLVELVAQRQRGKALVVARDLAEVLGVDKPTSFEQITDPRLVDAVLRQLGLGDDDPPPPHGGGADPDGATPPGAEGDRDGAVVSGDAAAPEPTPDERVAAISVSDVARYSTTVFRADYDAAPRGDKTKVVDRLRHALVWAMTDGAATSLNELEHADLFKVQLTLRRIAEGTVSYSHDCDGVTFVFPATGEERDVAWAELEQHAAA